MRKITPRQNTLFIESLTKKLIKLGTKDNTTEFFIGYDLILDTKGGLLYLRVDYENESMFTLWTRFADLEKAKEASILPKDKMNAKMNFHIVNNYKDAIKEIIEDLTNIL